MSTTSQRIEKLLRSFSEKPDVYYVSPVDLEMLKKEQGKVAKGMPSYLIKDVRVDGVLIKAYQIVKDDDHGVKWRDL